MELSTFKVADKYRDTYANTSQNIDTIASQKIDTNTSENTLTLTTNANANGVGYSVIRERGGAGSERANTKTRKTIQ